MMKVGVLGSGDVGKTLADAFLKEGHRVMLGSRSPGKLEAWKAEAGPGAQVGTFEQVADFGELLVLSVKGSSAEAVVTACGPNRFKGKTVIDTTNPIAEQPPENGVLRFFTSPNESLFERLQRLSPKANWVKAFNSVGHAHMVHPSFKEKPTMFICGSSNMSKNMVREILLQWGWEVEDMGAPEAARAIEPLCILWCIPGFVKNQWNHAFKLLKR